MLFSVLIPHVCRSLSYPSRGMYNCKIRVEAVWLMLSLTSPFASKSTKESNEARAVIHLPTLEIKTVFLIQKLVHYWMLPIKWRKEAEEARRKDSKHVEVTRRWTNLGYLRSEQPGSWRSPCTVWVWDCYKIDHSVPGRTPQCPTCGARTENNAALLKVVSCPM